MSFREKHLWISVIATVLVWSVYFRELVDRVLNGGMDDPRFAGVMGVAFAGAVFIVVVIEVSLTVFATLTTSKVDREARDEREMLAAFKASHVSLTMLIVLVISLALVAWFSDLTRGVLFGGPHGRSGQCAGRLRGAVGTDAVRPDAVSVEARPVSKGPPPIRNRIRELRFHAGEMTQAQLAERIGMTRQTIVAMEQGKYSPSLEAAFRIAAVFAVPLGEVFQWDG